MTITTNDVGISFDYAGFHVDRYFITSENKREERWAIYRGCGWDGLTIGWESSREAAIMRIDRIIDSERTCSQ